MQQRVLLTNISPETQKKFGFYGEVVNAIATDDVMGGSFRFRNAEGELITVDAVELTGTEIQIQEFE